MTELILLANCFKKLVSKPVITGLNGEQPEYSVLSG